MKTKSKSNASRTRHLGKIKLAITAGAVTMTLGFWTFFSQQVDQQAAAQAAPDPQVAIDPAGQLGLLPMPTLVPQSSTGRRANPPAANTGSSRTAITQFEQGVKLLLGGAQPAPVRPRTITRTRSSR
jgi:hypothetical protein